MNFLIEISKKPMNISELAKRCDLALSAASTLISRWARSKHSQQNRRRWKARKKLYHTYRLWQIADQTFKGELRKQGCFSGVQGVRVRLISLPLYIKIPLLT